MSTFTVDISNKIKTMLQTVANLNGVYEYEPATPTSGQYPFASITTGGAPEASFGDTQRNLRTYRFSIRVYQERTEAAFGNEKAERIIREIQDAVFTLFDENTTLDGMVKKVSPVTCDTEHVDREVGDTRVAEFLVDCLCVTDSN